MDPPTCWVANATTASLAIIAFLLLPRHLRRRKLNLPPRPKHWPIIGNLILIGSHHCYIHYLSQKYGPFMQLKFGSFPALVGFSGDMAKAKLETHELTFVNRPKTASGKYTTYNYSYITWSLYASRSQKYGHIMLRKFGLFLKNMFFSTGESSSLNTIMSDHDMPAQPGYKWYEDDARPKRTGTVWAASGSGVLSLDWAVAQLRWIAGPAVRSNLAYEAIKFVSSAVLVGYYLHRAAQKCVTMHFIAEIRNYFLALGILFLKNMFLSSDWAEAQPGWIDYFLVLEILLLWDWAKGQLGWIAGLAVRSNLGGAKVKICGYVQHMNVFGGAIGYTIAAFISMSNLQEIFNPFGFQLSGNKGKRKPKFSTTLLALLLFMVLLPQGPICVGGQLEPTSPGREDAYTGYRRMLIGTPIRLPPPGPHN